VLSNADVVFINGLKLEDPTLELAEQNKKDGAEIVERLERVGVLVHVHLKSGIGYHGVDQQPHAHLVCSDCGAESELAGETLQRLERLVEREHGFRPDFTHQAMSGRCLACQQVATRPARRRHRWGAGRRRV
jgi:hypothetical protein